MRMVYVIRDYERMKNADGDIESDLRDAIGHSLNGYVSVNQLDNIAESISEKLISSGFIFFPNETEVEAVEKAMDKIPEFYREPIYNNIISGDRYPTGADERTFRRYKQKFIYYVAKYLNKR